MVPVCTTFDELRKYYIFKLFSEQKNVFKSTTVKEKIQKIEFIIPRYSSDVIFWKFCNVHEIMIQTFGEKYMYLLLILNYNKNNFFCYCQSLRNVLRIINFYFSKVPTRSNLIGNHTQSWNRRIFLESKNKSDSRCNVLKGR